MDDLRFERKVEKVENKAPQRERLERDVENFLRSGGKITTVSKGNEELLAKRPRSAIKREVNF